LEEAGKAESTLVVFTSDNGGHPNYAGNAPLRGSKWNLYEGGIRVPFLVRWPNFVEPGSLNETAVWSPDLFPTFAELAGTNAKSARDGVSLLSHLREGSELPDRSMVWHFPYYHPEKKYSERIDEIGVDDGETSKTKPHSAIREGNWKLLWFQESDRVELYNLERDFTESRDLASSQLDVANRLRDELKRYLNSVDARMPTPNPDYQR
jgi:uncharacterized sulfatase